MTLPGTTLGSVHYFSPEQARGDSTTAASDIYSLGIVLYEMLTGVRPWEGDSAAGVALARLTGPIPDPAAVRSSVPAELAAITRRALARDAADRFPTASAMADRARGLAGDAAPAAAIGVAGAAPWRRERQEPQAGRAAAAAGAAGRVGASTSAGPRRRGVRDGPGESARVPYPPEAYVGRGRR